MSSKNSVPEAGASPNAKPGRKNDAVSGAVEVIKTIVYALLIAGAIRSFFFQPFNIPSGSMKDTLLIGDYLFVAKYQYGYSRHSFPFSAIPFEGRFMAHQPKRGDVVVFKMPNANSSTYMEDFIKRVIGLPGDRIQMKNGQLFLNGEAIPKVADGTFTDDLGDGYSRTVARYKETLPGGVSYDVLDLDPNGQLDNTPEFVVPAGHYFMMGDNRDDSDDSRAEVGYVPFEDLEGKAEMIFFSVAGDGHIWEFWKWPSAIRYGRIGRVIH